MTTRCKFWPMKHKHEFFTPSWNPKGIIVFTGILDHEDRGCPRNKRPIKSLVPKESHEHSYTVYAMDGLLSPIFAKEKKETSFLFKLLVSWIFVIYK